MEGMQPNKLHPSLSIDLLETTTPWAYAKRRDMQEIVKGLFLGPYSVAVRSKCAYLEEHGITHIVCIRQDVEAHIVKAHFTEKFQYLIINIADSVTENIIQHLGKVKVFLDSCFAQEGRALVHGNAGISRSAALVLGYLMQKYCLSYDDAFHLVQQKRFCINPNEGFEQQLKEYEPIYKAHRNMSVNGQCSIRELCNTKRKRENADDGNSMED